MKRIITKKNAITDWHFTKALKKMGKYADTLSKDKYFMSGYVITSCQTGRAIGQWTHNYGEFNISEYQTGADVIAHGTLSYGIPGTPLSIQTEQSFMYTDSMFNC